MNDAKSSSPRIATTPLLALVVVSFIGAVIAVCRARWLHSARPFYLPWNLFLAWLPLIFAIAAHRRHQISERLCWRFCGLALLWLLFFPNAPYICTDVIHVRRFSGLHFWIDLCIVLLFAAIGFLVGFISLYLMQSIIAQRVGRIASWIFILTIAILSGFGIYLGRFLRWNSWDAIMHPVDLTQSISQVAADPLATHGPVLFPALFTLVVLVGYVILYAITHAFVVRRQAINL